MVGALESAKYIIAMVNSNLPRTLGDGIIHYSRFDRVIYHDAPIYEAKSGERTDVENTIGK